MKKTFSLLWVILTLGVAIQSVNAQTATVLSCSSIKCDWNPAYSSSLYFGCLSAGSTTCAVVTQCPSKSREYRLLRKNGSTWGATPGIPADWGYQTQFDNLPKGRYKIEIRTPVPLDVPGCPNNRRIVQNIIGQNIGEVGRWDFTETNEVVVGAADLNDHIWNFIDPNNNNLFNFSQPIKMNTSQITHYTGWWLAIWEVDGNGQLTGWYAPGWKHTPIPAQIDLRSSEYIDNFSGEYKALPSAYYIQFAIATECNQSWVANDKWLYVCPSGWNCSGKGADKGLIVAPNPAANFFSILNLNLTNAENVEIRLTDLSGRVVKTFQDVQSNQFDISDLNNGMYLANVLIGGKRIQSLKVMVSK